jgi:voltage-gated potassium channel
MANEYNNHLRTFNNVTITLILILSLILISGSLLFNSGMTATEAFYNAFRLVTHIPGIGYNSFLISLISIIGGILVVYLILTLLSITYGGSLNSELMEAKKMGAIKKMKNHVIICGANTVGENIAVRLDANNKDFIVVGTDVEVINTIKAKKNFTLLGNPLQEEVLKEAGIGSAMLLLAVLDSEGDNALLTVMAKKLNPKIKVVAKSNNYKYVTHLENIGADLVMMPEVLGAFKIADVAKDILEM